VALMGERNTACLEDFIHYIKRNANMKKVANRNSRKASKLSKYIPRGAALTTCAALAVAGLVSLFGASDAQAFSCARSAYGAGCVGPRGAVGFNRNGAVAVGRYGNVYAYRRGSACYWHNNQRICP
jgi:hypothetical protein